jgi:hypothetical protein
LFKSLGKGLFSARGKQKKREKLKTEETREKFEKEKAAAYVSADLLGFFAFEERVAVVGLYVGVFSSLIFLSFHPPCRIDPKDDNRFILRLWNESFR